MVIALIDLDYTAMGGPLVATGTGWTWRLQAAVRDTADNRKEILSGYTAETLDNDNLIQVRDKLIAATKAEAATRGFVLTVAILDQKQVVAGL